TKDDFTYDSCKEHFAISKFLENLNSDTTDHQWVIAGENISVKEYVSGGLHTTTKQQIFLLNLYFFQTTSIKQQVRSEEVKKFWLDIDLEKAESERKLAVIILEQKEIELKQKEIDIKLSQAEFVIEHSKAGNKGHSLLNDQKLKYVENLGNDKETELEEKPSMKKSAKRKPVCSNGNLTETEDNEYFPDDDNNDLDPESFNSTLDRNNKKAIHDTISETNEADIIITPLKPVLSKKSAQYLRDHIEIKTNDRYAIIKTEEDSIQIPGIIYDWLVRTLSTNKEEFKTAIMAPFKPEEFKDLYRFRLVCEMVLCDFYYMTQQGRLERNIGERTYTAERIVPLFKALQSTYCEYKFHWIEIQVNSIKEMQKAFPNFDLIINKADGIGIKVSSNHVVIFIEVSGGPSNPDKNHIKDDAEKLLKEATFGLVLILRNYLDKSAEMAKNVKVYTIQCIGDRITLCDFSLIEKYRYKTAQIKSARLPFSFVEVADYLEDGLENQTKELHKLRLSPNNCVPKVRDWLWVPDTKATWMGGSMT
ncbi:6734_t:CDS:10, partial [Scutellospora calospora]